MYGRSKVRSSPSHSLLGPPEESPTVLSHIRLFHSFTSSLPLYVRQLIVHFILTVSYSFVHRSPLSQPTLIPSTSSSFRCLSHSKSHSFLQDSFLILQSLVLPRKLGGSIQDLDGRKEAFWRTYVYMREPNPSGWNIAYQITHNATFIGIYLGNAMDSFNFHSNKVISFPTRQMKEYAYKMCTNL